MRGRLTLILVLLLAGLLFPLPPKALPASLPKSTQEMLGTLKLEPSVLADIEKELQVPGGWIEGARREGRLRILSTLDPPRAEQLARPFKERYPFVSVEHSRGGHEERIVRTLVAYKNKRIVTDVITGLGGSFFMFKEADALEDLRGIPNLGNLPPGTLDPGGLWAGMHLRYWCMAYNTKLVKKEDLPRRWEDLLTGPLWRNGNLALGNRPQLWALPLWKAKGEQWTKEFLTKMLADVRPQLRKEGMNALVELAAAGEFHAIVPASEHRVYQRSQEGAPVSYACPEPVPAAVSEMGILKGAPNINAARLFVNWFLSKEGQIAQYVADFAPPVHRGLRRRELLPFADQILGKQSAFRDAEAELEIQPRLLEFWDGLWVKGGGKRR